MPRAKHNIALSDALLFFGVTGDLASLGVVDPVLTNHGPAHPYRRHSWGPKEADALIAADGGWHNPTSLK